MRYVTLVSLSLLCLCFSAFGQDTDPVGFCPPPASVSACTTANGPDNETIGVGTTSIGMEKNGNGTSNSPWFLILALPNYTGSAPTLTISGFTQQGSAANDGHFLPTTSGSLYDFTSTTGDSSMNASNLFGSDEHTAFGATPSFFDVFVYTFTPAFDSNVAYTLNFGSALPAGTFLAGSGGSHPFSTPFTTTGLVDGPGCTGTNGCTAGPGSGPSVPEPTSIALLGSVCLLVTSKFRKRRA
jgi:hypothetical protein